MKRFKHPFTLVELLCVIIVIALLAAISVKVTQIAYRRADETKTKTVMEIIRVANEQYKIKKGYYYPNGGDTYNEGGGDFHSISLNPEFLGDTTGLLRPGLTFDPQPAWEKVRDEIVAKLLPVK